MPHPKPDAPYLDFDGEKIIRHAGGANGLRQLLSDAGYAVPPLSVVYQWGTRGTVSRAYALTAVYLLMKTGRARFIDLVRTVGVAPK
jgi:hypothetical protein